jgi:magnesium-transporting ATPase (P-type)
LDTDGTEEEMKPLQLEELEALIKEYASQALRCVAICHRHNIETVLKDDPNKASLADVEKHLEKEMTFAALVGIADPLRKDVIDAVATCRRAGSLCWRAGHR